uniref:N-acetyltransferase domain-containing protein n=1 Tax=Rhodosorus marinus TaxID=101924 RepID=A0A7S3EQB6_9RHOD|mmetsp:Transcript_9543/g.41193  ORF Transcript_9543/g.41193 Transcript_9543/m.41193 type:complete len:198 (+) Transcript_9543:1512-2105(+)|eukprot:CAMPEP_0113961792 /NCGR_PEP_ID=MMETSP0011_2-20120614/5528_1 /TAXON_ID=101924 /ORGANISM="Rhodosorus marinus" /LENGTH=197 /DNA_ID=CAMNT_0000973517 /DNA_START=2512 /DNA_END=3105 /DNA_ORIENTATION=+ /assembly_acc=CAM_ASM_000156
MRCNEKTRLVGDRIDLVPYCKRHVVQYHEWMKDPWIREMTCSEPLTLEEEYENQVSWHLDEHKMTFIVLDKNLDDGCPPVGDVNLFLVEEGDEDTVVAEVEVMIAEPRSRRRGLATEAVKLMVAYGVKHLGCNSYVAKIVETNEGSINMFNKLGFKQLRRLEVFKEVHLILRLSAEEAESYRAEIDGREVDYQRDDL